MNRLSRVALAFLLLIGVVPSQAHAAPAFDQQVLFNPHQETGYACFRIPAIVRSASGTLLAFAEGRRDNCGDTGDIDLVVKRSTDGGTTWSPLRVVNPGGGDTHGNPVPIVDSTTGRIVLITTYNKGRDDDQACDVPCPRAPHAQYSDDDGRTWSVPVDISAQAKLPEWDSWYASGPVHGIQLAHGRHAGRLVFGVNAERSAGTDSVENYGALVYSDDHGRSWQVGAVDSYPHPVGGTYAQKPSEISVAELPDGTIYAGGREQGGTDVGNRDYALSRDGGATFSRRFTTIPDLVTPMVQGCLLRLERPGGQRLLFASPADTDRRRWMTIRSSYDGGRTWENTEQGTRITTDWSGYSDLVQLSGPHERDARIGLLYEGGAVDARDEIRFVRFDENHLGWRRSPGPSTPDLANRHSGGILGGGATVEPGRFGGAVRLDGVDDFVRVRYSPGQLVGAGDFTYSTWFRYGASKQPQALLWLSGMGATAPQLWLRAEPADRRLVAAMTTSAGSRSVTTAQAYDDQQWHHLVLQRTGGALRILVDGAVAATGPDSPGSVSETVSFQLLLGERPDGTQQLAGALDDTRLYRRALTGPELTRVSAGAAVPGAAAWLPFDHSR
ncbi:sialidase family protein [Amycolatopsis jiangsuensis]|uniref:exo-alpha-sialidase n=1 Tax=Amycolatopsis jiangsuensis TaxID=1181879 RepID=A0A840ISW9_9PSEU|nr:sialidase family protein [Amycolatopsis jiangsuensis]MBB4684302.1 sialidase-1 [Amycolatopsis jiangsuensis]